MRPPTHQTDVNPERTALYLTRLATSRNMGPTMRHNLAVNVHESSFEDMVAEMSTAVLTQRLIDKPVEVRRTKTVHWNEYLSGWDHLKADLYRKVPAWLRRPLVAVLGRSHSRQCSQRVVLSATVHFHREAIFPEADLVVPLDDPRLGRAVIWERADTSDGA